MEKGNRALEFNPSGDKKIAVLVQSVKEKEGRSVKSRAGLKCEFQGQPRTSRQEISCTPVLLDWEEIQEKTGEKKVSDRTKNQLVEGGQAAAFFNNNGDAKKRSQARTSRGRT